MKKRPIPVLFVAMIGTAFVGSGMLSVAQPKSPPVVQSVVPSSNISLAKGDSTLVTLKGANFIYISSAQLIRADAQAKLAAASPLQRTFPPKVSLTGVRTPTSLGLLLEAPASAPDGLYVLRLLAGGEAFDVPAEILKVNIIWGRPQITDYVPRQAPVGSTVTVRGKYFGDPSQPEKTQCLIRAGRAGETLREVAAEAVSFSPAELKVRVPDFANYGNFAVVTPGGRSPASSSLVFDPLYFHAFPPELFRSTGTLGVMKFWESQFVFANGDKNSVFIPSSAMRASGFPEAYYFDFPPYEKLVNLVIGSTKIRVRLNGTNRSLLTESLRTTNLDMLVDGIYLKVAAVFESQGVEFVGEYETQDILSKKITWHKFLDINIDNLTVYAALTPAFPSARDVMIQNVITSSTFNAGFVVLDTNISVDQTPIKDYIKSELEASLRNYFLSESFKSAFGPILGGFVQTLFGGANVHIIDVARADDGGMKLIGSTRWVR